MKTVRVLLFIGILILIGCHRNSKINTVSNTQPESLSINITHIDQLYDALVDSMILRIPGIYDSIFSKKGDYNRHLGWVDLPSHISEEEIADIERTAEELRKKSDVIVIIGIGGSYLGARAVIESLSDYLVSSKETPTIVYAGHNMSEEYMYDLLSFLEGKDFSLIIISKSGNTLEPTLAFRILKHRLDNIYSPEEAARRTIIITGEPQKNEKGDIIRRTPLDSLALHLDSVTFHKYKTTFYIPEDIGGRFSVLTPVGLLPIAMGGFDIKAFIKGAETMEIRCKSDTTPDNPATQYALARQTLYKNGKTIEIMVNYEPRLMYFSEWWKQLYGESLGKDNKGVFPASVTNSTDLHSLGQYIQGCPKQLFETVLSVDNPPNKIVRIPLEKNDLDGLNHLADKRLSEINHLAEYSVTSAHEAGGVPNIQISIPIITEYSLGELMYFFELSCAISGYLMGIDPFNQPNVDQYKVILKEKLKE